ncbi:branched-chain amino acid aminotransferase 2, chloroplastic isoform X2 [Tanacetum coccineum]
MGLFDGLKAYQKEDGNISFFHPEENATRMITGAQRMCMPSPFIPPPGKGSLYIMSLLMGSGSVLNLAPTPKYTFLIYVSPVGNYFKDEGTAWMQGKDKDVYYVILAECKIISILMVDHALSHALTATVDVPVVDVLQLPVETPKNPFIIPADLKYIPGFLKIVGYEGIVDKKKDLISYPHFTKLIIDDHIKKFPSISLRLKEDYHSIKDDVPLGSVYTTGNMTV